MYTQRLKALVCGAVVAGCATTAFAQPAPNREFVQQQPAPAPVQQNQSQPAWDSFPTMVLEKIYRGPLRDTVIQRWRDPVDNTVCYIYLPISVPLSQNPGQYAQYGAASLGNISCFRETVQVVPTPPAVKR